MNTDPEILALQNLLDLQNAIGIAIDAHDGQLDKAGKPYLWHALRVGISLLPNVDAAIVGILHDVLEDADPAFFRGIVRAFPSKISATVCILTRLREEPYPEYIARVGRDSLARMVKLADLRDNLDPARLAAARSAGSNMETLTRRYLDAWETLLAMACEDRVTGWELYT